MQAKERKEVVELKNEVKKLKEKAQLRKLKEQVGNLRKQVLQNEEEEVRKEEDEDKAHVDTDSIKDAFERVNVDGDDVITVDQVKVALKDLDLEIDSDLLHEVLAAEGVEARDGVDLQGFTDIVDRVQEKLEEFGERPRVCEDKLRDIFDHFDADHDGEINKGELSAGLAELGVDLPEAEIDAMLAQIKAQEARDKEADDKEAGVYSEDDGRGTGEDGVAGETEEVREGGEEEAGAGDEAISFEEFKNFALREAFDEYDSNESGYISAEELRSLAGDLGVAITLARARALQKKYDHDGDERMDFQEFTEAWLDFCTVHAKPEKKRMWVCDGLGCGWKDLSPVAPKSRGWGWTWRPPSAAEGKKEALTDGASLFDLIFPWEHTWDSEVSLNAKGQIRAHHDDPHQHLMPHNKYQNAEYPDGVEHVRTDGQTAPGVTNQVATHLFADNIVTAAPGFNAGTGRHTRAQQAVDWERNWEGRRESKLGRDAEGKPLIVGN